jgi:uncharacterized protein (TIGR02001 family)
MVTAAACHELQACCRPLRPLRRARRWIAWPALPVVVLAGAASSPASAQRVQAHVSLASDYVVRGVSRSQGDPSLQAQLGVDVGANGSAGISAATMNLNPGPGPNRELAVYVSRSKSLARDWTLAGSLTRYFYSPQIPGLPYDYSEARLELSWRDRAQVGVAASPDYSVRSRRGVARASTALEYTLTVLQPLTSSVALSAGVGQFDLSDGLGLRYAYWSASAVYTGRRTSLALTWTDAEAATRTLFSAAATGNRLIATVSWRLQ